MLVPDPGSVEAAGGMGKTRPALEYFHRFGPARSAPRGPYRIGRLRRPRLTRMFIFTKALRAPAVSRPAPGDREDRPLVPRRRTLASVAFPWIARP